jgi:energy-coupling factor transporter ATP-binding protein EcfA2
MLKRFEVENFQAFGAGQVADLAPITLVLGPNSAGKSSLIRALKAVVQSFPAPDESYPLKLDGKLINLGTFKAAAHLHDTTRSPRFALTFAPAPEALAEVSRRGLQNIGVSLLYALRDGEARLREIEFRGIPVEDARYHFLCTTPNSNVPWLGTVPDDLLSVTSILEVLAETLTDEERRANIRRQILAQGEDTNLSASDDRTEEEDDFSPVEPSWIRDARQTVPWKLPVPDDEPGQSRDYAWTFYPIAVLLKIFCSQTNFLAPLRPTPDRLIGGIRRDARAGTEAGRDVRALLHQNPALLSELNKALPRYGFDYQIEMETSALADSWNDEKGSRLVLHDLGRNSIPVLLTDVGVGVSQALPIMVEALEACAVEGPLGDPFLLRKMLVVEQPELHLHPRLQSKLTDFFTWTAGVDSGQPLAAPQRPIQWLVETHSEAMVLRIQRRIREGRIAPESISILYVSPDSSGSTIKRLRLDRYGQFIDDWPDGFFVESLDEVFGAPGEVT